jgi:hypothetical protein
MWKMMSTTSQQERYIADLNALVSLWVKIGLGISGVVRDLEDDDELSPDGNSLDEDVTEDKYIYNAHHHPLLFGAIVHMD